MKRKQRYAGELIDHVWTFPFMIINLVSSMATDRRQNEVRDIDHSFGFLRRYNKIIYGPNIFSIHFVFVLDLVIMSWMFTKFVTDLCICNTQD